MKVLGIDTSTALLSAAVLDDGRLAAECARESTQSGDRRPGRSNHAEGLIPVIDEVLRRADTDFSSLSLVGVAVGPGSFTGLRIGISTAKGLVYGSDVPVLGVRTLAAAAYRVPAGDGATFVCPMIDARKGEVYGALYRRAGTAFECLVEDSLAARRTWPAGGLPGRRPMLFVGTGARPRGRHRPVYRGAVGSPAGPIVLPSLRGCPASPKRVPLRAGAEPLTFYYIRPPDAVASLPARK